jgi:hypothetical protein
MGVGVASTGCVPLLHAEANAARATFTETVFASDFLIRWAGELEGRDAP